MSKKAAKKDSSKKNISKKESSKKESSKKDTKSIGKKSLEAANKSPKKAPSSKDSVGATKPLTSKPQEVKSSATQKMGVTALAKTTVATKAEGKSIPKASMTKSVSSAKGKVEEAISTNKKSVSPKLKAKAFAGQSEETLVHGEMDQSLSIKAVSAEESLPTKKAKKYEGVSEEESKWLELRDKYRHIKPQVYKLSESFQEKTPLEHKVLGWGFILSVVNDRLEVLFRSGIKHLISNYKTQG